MGKNLLIPFSYLNPAFGTPIGVSKKAPTEIFAGAFLGFFVCGLLVTLNDDRRKK